MTKKEIVLQNILSMKENHNGMITDGDHTFDELYHHREVLCETICSLVPQICFKSKKHYDGSSYDDYFIFGVMTPAGLATYHYQMTYWDNFPCKEFPCAPKFDGHTPNDVIDRLTNLGKSYTESVAKGLFLEKLSRKLTRLYDDCIEHTTPQK